MDNVRREQSYIVEHIVDFVRALVSEPEVTATDINAQGKENTAAHRTKAPHIDERKRPCQKRCPDVISRTLWGYDWESAAAR